MNESHGSTSQEHHPQLERGALTLLALGALLAIWLGIGLPGLPPAIGGPGQAAETRPLVAHLDTVAPHVDATRAHHPQVRPLMGARRAHHTVRSLRASAAPIAGTPAAPAPRQTTSTEPRRSDPVAASPPPVPVAPAPPLPGTAPMPVPDPTQAAAGDVQARADDAVAALPSESDVQKTVQAATSAATNALPQSPTLPVP